VSSSRGERVPASPAAQVPRTTPRCHCVRDYEPAFSFHLTTARRAGRTAFLVGEPPVGRTCRRDPSSRSIPLKGLLLRRDRPSARSPSQTQRGRGRPAGQSGALPRLLEGPRSRSANSDSCSQRGSSSGIRTAEGTAAPCALGTTTPLLLARPPSGNAQPVTIEVDLV